MKALFLVLGLALFLFSGCSKVNPAGDEEAVIIKHPWFFGHGGVSSDAIGTGLTWAAPTTDYVKYKIVPITFTENFDDLISDDNTPVDFNAYLKIRIKKNETPNLHKNFGQKWYENSIAPTFRAVVRDKASTYKMFDLAGNRAVLLEIEKYVFEKTTDYCKGLNIPLEIMQVTIGAVTPPPEVLEETRRTAAQNQSILTQEARAKSESSRRQAEVNKAIADKAYQNQMNMTVTDYLHLRALEIEKEKIELVREKQNVSIIMGQGIIPTYGVK